MFPGPPSRPVHFSFCCVSKWQLRSSSCLGHNFEVILDPSLPPTFSASLPAFLPLSFFPSFPFLSVLLLSSPLLSPPPHPPPSHPPSLPAPSNSLPHCNSSILELFLDSHCFSHLPCNLVQPTVTSLLDLTGLPAPVLAYCCLSSPQQSE